MERKLEFAPGEYYHVYNRGVDKRKIFLSPRDYQRFLYLLYVANSAEPVHLQNLLRVYKGESLIKVFAHPRGKSLVAVGAYCLMPNHFHLLLKELADNGISKFMLKLQTAYSMFFNTKYDRSGSLFQGIFKAEHAPEDDYLRYLYSYIHLNPAKIIDTNWQEKFLTTTETQKLFNYVTNYQFSSYRLYLATDWYAPESNILSKEEFPDYFEGADGHQREVLEWLYIKGSP